MANLLALEWDQSEARVVVAQRRPGGGVTIEHAFVVSLAPRDAGETFVDTNVGERLQAALAARRVGRVDTFVAVGRSNIELRRLTLPPAPDEDLPDMVRFSAVPQFSNLGDDWPLDYFKLASTGGEGQSVLAAAISPQLVEQIKTTCSAAGLTPTRLILRPCAAASLVVNRGASTSGVRLLVDLLAEEADLTVLVDRDIVLMRTVRLPATSASDQVPALVGEIRRTIAAAQNQLGGKRVEEIVLCGLEAEQRELAAQINDKIGLPTTSFNPFDGLSLSNELRQHQPEQPGRFAPLLGLVVDEAAGRAHLIDFLNPRKRPVPPNNKRIYMLAAAAVGVLLLSVLVLERLQIWSLQNKRDMLVQQSLDLDQDVERGRQIQVKAAAVDVWEAGSVNWLDELASFSSPQRFPVAEDARLVNWRVGTTPTGGRMGLEVRARDSSVIPELEELVRDERHTVKSGQSVEDKEGDARYPWRFEETVDIAPPASKELDAARELLKPSRRRSR